MCIIISITEAEVIALQRAEIEELKALVAKLTSQIDYLTKQQYGAKSEKLDPNQLELLEGAGLGKSEPLPDALEDAQEEANSKSEKHHPKPRRSKEDLYPKNLRVEVVEERTPQEVLDHPEDYEKIGVREHDLLHHQRAELYWKRTLTGIYKKKSDRNLPPLNCSAPVPPIMGAKITPELGAHLVVAKYCDHLPHYRQSAIWEREQEIILGRKTINRWTQAVAESVSKIYEAIGRELRIASVLQVDETPIRYLKPGNGKSKQGYLWVMRNPVTGTVYYNWETTRSKDGLKRTLGWDEQTNTLDYRGTIQCDGYKAYLSLVKEFLGIQLGSCLAHIRRKFLKDESFQNTPWGAAFIVDIQALYKIERRLKSANAPPDERRRVRQQQAKPIAQKLYQTLIVQKPKHRPKSAIGEAISYALAEWEGFERYLEDGKLDIDNNGVENAIRPTKLGAKNYLFFGSAEAGEYNAVLYTLLENCKVLGINPRAYLEYVILALQTTPPEELTPSKLLPILQSDSPLVA